MLTPSNSPEPTDALDTFATYPAVASSATSAALALAKNPVHSLLAASLLETVIRKRNVAAEQKDSLEDFCHVYCTRLGGNAGRCVLCGCRCGCGCLGTGVGMGVGGWLSVSVPKSISQDSAQTMLTITLCSHTQRGCGCW